MPRIRSEAEVEQTEGLRRPSLKEIGDVVYGLSGMNVVPYFDGNERKYWGIKEDRFISEEEYKAYSGAEGVRLRNNRVFQDNSDLGDCVSGGYFHRPRSMS